ncbi:MAG: transcriptional regulator [Alphaproteobacteria bacterium]|nr:MAG: transcriptional regulator [Alphaproteobacteria bacterium]
MALERDLRWQPLAWVGLEHCHVSETADGIAVRSSLIGEREGFAFGAFYEIQLDPDWTFRSVTLRRHDGRVMRLVSNGEGDWKLDGQRAPALEGCVDIDISGSPFTNTLPMRRRRFETDVPQRFDMAWIPLDTLEPFRDGQIYTQLDDTHFRYEAADRSFTQVLTVDEHRFVLDYPTLFRRV